MNLRDSLFYSLDSSKEYRAGFVEEKIRTGLAAQLRTIRERLPHPDGLSRPMTQAEFAKFLGKSQSWVSRLEDPNEPIPTVPTLLLISSKLDIGLKVAFVSFAELLDDMSGLSPDTLHVPSFREDRKLFPRQGPVGEHHSQSAAMTLRATGTDAASARGVIVIPFAGTSGQSRQTETTETVPAPTESAAVAQWQQSI